jgi:NAD(P)-dependent dehydrogenase (short-subunit alcohol dehydrogenase family)
MDTGVRDLVVLVTGASGAIGREIAYHFAAGGAPSRSRTAQIELVLSTWRQNWERGAVLPRTNKARVQLALLASCGGKRWVVEEAGSVLDELDAAVEGSAFDHVERDVGVAVVDAF